MSKKVASTTRRRSPAKAAKVARSTAPATTRQPKPFLYREVELGLMGLVAVILVVLFIGVAGTMALSYSPAYLPL